MKNQYIYIIIVKPILDFLFSFLAIIILAPLFFIISLIILAFNGRPVFFLQPRPGKDGKVFTMIKYRTMSLETNALGDLLPDEKRTTKIGFFLRRTSLDELPQLINIIKGDISFVGPRPLLVEYLPYYSDFQKRRHNVKPGITGWAQVNGRNCISWEEKFKLDVYYVEKVSFLLDMKIIFRTVSQSFRGNGIYNSDGKPMEKFQGKNI